jgi:formylmethanofuran dehydrogenase subunit E
MDELRFIGKIHTPYQTRAEAPRQGRLTDITSTIEIFEEYAAGLEDIDESTHLYILYWLHLSERDTLTANPPGDGRTRGVFATRSPNRPNPIGLTAVELVGRDGRFLEVRALDCLDGTPLLDIKPYSAKIDSHPDARIGWLRDEDLKR